MGSWRTIFWLGTKELQSLRRDTILIILIVYSFSMAVFMQATASSSGVHNAAIAFVDEDHSGLSRRLAGAFHPPQFQAPVLIAPGEVDPAMDRGRFLFVVVIPPRFEADLRRGSGAEVQIQIDGTANKQASVGDHDIQRYVAQEVDQYFRRTQPPARVRLASHVAYNPNFDTSWFNAVIALINQVTIVAVALSGAALIREREHGTIEHLLVMPVNAFEIALAKVWANGLAMLAATALSLGLVVALLLRVPIAGSVALFMTGTVVYLFFVTALGVFVGTVVRTMDQFSLLVLIILVALQLLSGGSTPVESQPDWLRTLTLALPTRHFVTFSEDILYRGAGWATVWPSFLAIAGLGLAIFAGSLWLFRRSMAPG